MKVFQLLINDPEVGALHRDLLTPQYRACMEYSSSAFLVCFLAMQVPAGRGVRQRHECPAVQGRADSSTQGAVCPGPLRRQVPTLLSRLSSPLCLGQACTWAEVFCNE